MVSISKISADVRGCALCPRLVEWRQGAKDRAPKRFRGDEYWGKGVPGFGDQRADLMVVGLAPAADGANRTGRMFTGDKSGDFLYAALFRQGFANHPGSVGPQDGLKLTDCYVTSVVKCAPPDNRPTVEERANCSPYLASEISLIEPKVIVALGKWAFDGLIKVLKSIGMDPGTPIPRFGHGERYEIGNVVVYASYHPSQQNTFTGRLSVEMFDLVVKLARFDVIKMKGS